MYYLGIDLGGTNIAAGIVNEEMEMVYKKAYNLLLYIG